MKTNCATLRSSRRALSAWMITVAATAASMYALDAVAMAAGVLLVASQLLSGRDHSLVLAVLAATYVSGASGCWRTSTPTGSSCAGAGPLPTRSPRRPSSSPGSGCVARSGSRRAPATSPPSSPRRRPAACCSSIPLVCAAPIGALARFGRRSYRRCASADRSRGRVIRLASVQSERGESAACALALSPPARHAERRSLAVVRYASSARRRRRGRTCRTAATSRRCSRGGARLFGCSGTVASRSPRCSIRRPPALALHAHAR